MYIFIRKAGFWNAKKYNIGSQFGHIMLCIDDYSFKNNCTLECQRALEYAGISFPKDFILPGNVLAYLYKPHANLQVKKITKVKISDDLPI